LAACAAWGTGCGGSSTTGLGQGDGGAEDATADDSSVDSTVGDAQDAQEGSPGEASPPEGGPAETGPSDGGPPDSTLPDATSNDAGDGSSDGASSDGTSLDSQAQDGAGPDAPSDAGSDAITDASADSPDDSPFDAGNPSLCADSLFVFCDGFEQSILTNWTAIATGGGEATLDAVHVYRGAHALHVSTDPVVEAGINPSAQVHKYGPGLYPTHIFTRFFAYMPSPAPTYIMNFIDLIQNGGAYTGLELRVEPTTVFGEVTFSTTANQAWQSADASFTYDQWVCLEIEVDTGAETQHVYMNDSEITDLAQTNLALGTVGDLGIGLGFTQPGPQPRFDAWIDEVAVDTAYIPCAK
jgi:hypothetical protein